MKLRCERDQLAEALAATSRAASSRVSNPALSGVRLALEGGTLRLTGSDGDTTISSAVPVSGDGDGRAVINAKLLTDIVRSLPEGAVELTVESEGATIAAGRSQFSVPTIPSEGFPTLAEPTGDAVSLDPELFGNAIRQVVSAAAADNENREALRSVLIEAAGGGVKLVATDSYRLAVRDLPTTSLLDEGGSVLVPRHALQELQRMLSGAESLTVRLGDNKVAFEVDGSYLVTSLIDEKYPDYRPLIPEAHPNKLTVGREALIDAVKRVRVVAKQTAATVRLGMSSGGLELTASTQDYGTAFEQIDVDYVGEDLTVAFNPEFLLAGLEACIGDEVVLETVDARRPALLRSADGNDFRYVLMPVRI